MEFVYHHLRHAVALFAVPWRGRTPVCWACWYMLTYAGRSWIIPGIFCCWHVGVLMAWKVRRNICLDNSVTLPLEVLHLTEFPFRNSCLQRALGALIDLRTTVLEPTVQTHQTQQWFLRSFIQNQDGTNRGCIFPLGFAFTSGNSGLSQWPHPGALKFLLPGRCGLFGSVL